MDYDLASFKKTFDFVKYIKSLYAYSEEGDRLYICCPFHSEETPSCLIDDKGYYCFGCSEYGDSIDFIQRTEQLSFKETILKYTNHTEFINLNKKPRKIKSRTVRPNFDIAERYYYNLANNDNKKQYLYNRLIDDLVIDSTWLGYGKPSGFSYSFKSPRYTIPVLSPDNYLLTIRYRIDPEYDNNIEPKYLAHPNTPTYLYNLADVINNKEVLIVGSELDAAFLSYRYSIPACAPPGENVFKSSWAEYFQDKNVLIWLDNDSAGRNGSINIYKAIRNVAKKAIIYCWDYSLPKKYDIGDFAKEYGIAEIYREIRNTYAS